MTQHPAREAGQTWGFDFDGIETSTTYRKFTLTDHRGEMWFAEDESGREQAFATETEFREMPHMYRLISSPSASPASGPPAGYVACDKGCGRWTRPTGDSEQGNRCYTCCGSQYRNFAHLDWTPPLESKPAEMVTIPLSINDCSELTNIPPAQEAPKAPVCMWHERHKCNLPIRERVVKVGTMSLCDWAMHQNEKLITWRTVGSGTHYAGPERLPKAKLAHSFGLEDPALEDA